MRAIRRRPDRARTTTMPFYSMKFFSLPLMSDEQFDFGKNWQAFSRDALTAQHVEQAKQAFVKLLEGIELKNQSFLDIGFGQGLSLLIAKALGARTVGCDINPLCADVFAENK